MTKCLHKLIQRYVKTLINNDRASARTLLASSNSYDITKERLKNALSTTKNGEVPWPDDIPGSDKNTEIKHHLSSEPI